MGQCVYHNSAKLFQKSWFFNKEKDSDSNDPFSTLKHSTEQLQYRDSNLVPENVTYDDILTFDD